MNVRKELFEKADPGYKEYHLTLIPGAMEIIGVRMPILRQMSKDICKGDWRAFLKSPMEYHEEHMLTAFVIAKADMSFEERMELTKKFVTTIKNWAVCDAFCGEIKVKNVKDKEKLWEYCLDLIDTDDEFKMRVAAVMMLDQFIDDDHIHQVLDILSTKYHPGYYYKMGVAWTLSTCYLDYPDLTERALFSDSLDKEIRNKSIQKISDSFRVSKENKERLKARKKEQDS